MSFPDPMPPLHPLTDGSDMARAADSVSATISQDRTIGASAAEESSFGMLAGHDTAGSSTGAPGDTINPALLSDTTRMPYNPPAPNFPHLPGPHRQVIQLQGPLPGSSSSPSQMSNHALQDYQMQLMLLEQQNKKRLLMARQEQDVNAGDVDMDAGPSDPPEAAPEVGDKRPDGNRTSENQDMSAQTKPPAREAATKPSTEPAGKQSDAPVEAGSQSPGPRGPTVNPAADPVHAMCSQLHIPLPVYPNLPQLSAPVMAKLDDMQRMQAVIPPQATPEMALATKPATMNAQAEQLRPMRPMTSGRAPIPGAETPSSLGSAPSLVQELSRYAKQAQMNFGAAPGDNSQALAAQQRAVSFLKARQEAERVRAKLQAEFNSTSALYAPTAAQLAAQQAAMHRGEQMALQQAGERERMLQETNNRLKAQMAQMWDWNRKMMAAARPGQPAPGPPAILLAQNDKSLFSEGPSGSEDQAVRDRHPTSPSLEKSNALIGDEVHGILMPDPFFGAHRPGPAHVPPQMQPGSPGNGRKRSRDEIIAQEALTAPASETVHGLGVDSQSSLREKRSRIVPITETPEQMPTSVDDNDWECVAISPPLENGNTTFEPSTNCPGMSSPSASAKADESVDAQSPLSIGTLPELDDALMVDASDDLPQPTHVIKTPAVSSRAMPMFWVDPYNDDPDQYHRTLHRVHCSRATCRDKIYEDEPVAHGDHTAGCGHIAGSTLISDLKKYIAQNRSVAWFVYRDHECPQQTHRDWTKPNESTSNEIHVVSGELKRAINSASRCMPESEAQPRCTTNTFNRPAPPDGSYRPRFLYHHRDALRSLVLNELPQRYVSSLLWYLGHNSPDSGQVRRCDNYFSQGMVSAAELPWLFCPNTIVISYTQAAGAKSPVAYVVEDWPFEVDGGLQLNCWSWGYNGQSLRRRQTCLTVKAPMDKVVDITSLSVYPATYMTAETRHRLVSRGSQFWQYRQQHHVSYQGWDYQKERKYAENSRFMIDYQTYRKFHGASAAFSFSHAVKALYDNWPESIANTSNPSEDNLMLLPPEIHGFYLKDKRWVCLCLDQVNPISWNKLAFERLVLPQKTKTLVQAMVLPRANRDAEAEPDVRADLIAGKGNGLIMLLHGPPGTGKTLTAESVAELAEMPLYSVTCGDIGTSPEAVERYLNTVLHLGKTWNCVLLLDEADVFLEQRSMADLDRNSLVSVFLRTLEYYSGILILTSNRVSIFDEAFKSRIQVSLSYPRLDRASRQRVWTNFLNMAREDGGRAPTEAAAKFRIDYPSILSHMGDLARCELNGRQIRNAMATARQLAGFLDEPLSWEHLETAITTASDFTISRSSARRNYSRSRERSRSRGATGLFYGRD